MSDPRLDRLASVLVRYSTGVKPGDLVAITSPPLAEAAVLAVYREVLEAGGHPLVNMVPESCAELLLKHGSAGQLEFVNPLEQRQVELVNVSIHLLAPENTRALTQAEPSRQALRGKARRQVMDRFLSRAADKSLRWVVAQLPCQASAQDAEMSLSEYADFVYRAGFLHEANPTLCWKQLSEQQARLADVLSRCRELHFQTPRGTDLRLGIEGRAWINCDGHENFPDGEVFTGPIEDATEGTVCFDFPGVHKGVEVQRVRLRFRAGKVVDASADKGEEFLLGMLDQDAGARILGEVAIGCNYAVTRYTRNTLFDEKIGGTFHVALGAAYPESGGKNQSALHWDLVCDLRQGGTVEVDGQLISENGRFQREGWPRMS